MATIKEIAKLAGVSHVTVSKVLAGESRVTRPSAVKRAQKIRDIAEQLGYRPNHSAQSLRSGKTGLIAVLGNSPLSVDEQNYEELYALRQIAVKLREQRLTLCSQLCERAEKNCAMPPWKVDGAILVAAPTLEQVQDVEQAGMPYVALNGAFGPNGSAVVFDDAMGIRLALDKLVEFGHRRIAYLANLHPFDHRSVHERLAGYQHHMPALGLTPLPTYETGKVGEETLHEHLRHLVWDHGCTAVICWDPWVALYTYRAAGELGLSLPGDLSVVTFNDAPLGSDGMVPRLSAVTRPITQTADKVVEMLLSHLEDPSHKPRIVTLKPRLITRESIAPPRDPSTLS